MTKRITAKQWRELLENSGFDNLLRSVNVGLSVFRSDFLDDSPFAEMDDMDKLDVQEFLLHLIGEITGMAKAINQCMTEQKA